MKNILKIKKIKFLLIFAFFSLFPIFSVSAFLGWKQLPVRIVTGIAMIPVLVTSFIARLSTSFLSWIIQPNALGMNYTDNIVTKTGLNITSNFINLILVLILVYIAVSTALDLGKIKTERTIVWLILLALLVNFAPLLVGLVVDFSNVITYFFLEEITDFTDFSNAVEGWGNRAAQTAQSAAEGKQTIGSGLGSVIGEAMGLLIFNIFVSLIFFLFFFLFLVRYVAIWVLVILSPLAIISFITPKTKKYFDEWLKSLMQWTFIAVPVSFFLYLGTEILRALPGEMTEAHLEGVGSTTTFIGQLLPYIVVIVFLTIGMLTSLKISVPGTGKIMEKYKGATGKLQGATGKLKDKSWDLTKRGSGRSVRALGEKAVSHEKREKLASYLSEVGNKENSRKLSKVAGWAGANAIGSKMAEYNKKRSVDRVEGAKGEIQKKYKKDDYKMQASSKFRENRLAAAELMAKEGKLEDLNNPEKIVDDAKKMGRTDIITELGKQDKSILLNNAENVIGKEKVDKLKGQKDKSKEEIQKDIEGEATGKMTKSLKEEDWKNLDKDWIEDKKFQEEVAVNKSFNFTIKAEDNPNTSGLVDKIVNRIKSESDFAKTIKDKNGGFLTKMTKTQAGKEFYGDDQAKLLDIIKNAKVEIEQGETTSESNGEPLVNAQGKPLSGRTNQGEEGTVLASDGKPAKTKAKGKTNQEKDMFGQPKNSDVNEETKKE